MNRAWATLGASSLAVASLATPAMSQEIPRSLQFRPAGREMEGEYADWKCLLHRDFSSAGKAIVFSLSLPPLIRSHRSRSPSGRRGKQDDGKAVMFVDGSVSPDTLHYNVYGATNSEKPYRIREFFLHLERHSPGSAKERIRFWTKRDGDVEVQVSGFSPPGRALQMHGPLYRELGIDQSAVAQITTEPKGDIHSFLNFRTSPTSISLAYWVSAEGGRFLPAAAAKREQGFLRIAVQRLEGKGASQAATNAAVNLFGFQVRERQHPDKITEEPFSIVKGSGSLTGSGRTGEGAHPAKGLA